MLNVLDRCSTFVFENRTFFVPSWGEPGTPGNLSGQWCPSLCQADANNLTHKTVACQRTEPGAWKVCADANHSADAESPVGNGWWRPHDGLKHYQGDVQAITDFGFEKNANITYGRGNSELTLS